MLGDTPGTTLPHQLPVMMTVPPPHVAIPPPPLLNVRRHPIATPPGGGRRRVHTPVEEYPFLGKSCTHVHGTILHGEPVVPSPGGTGFRGVPCVVHFLPLYPVRPVPPGGTGFRWGVVCGFPDSAESEFSPGDLEAVHPLLPLAFFSPL